MIQRERQFFSEVCVWPQRILGKHCCFFFQFKSIKMYVFLLSLLTKHSLGLKGKNQLRMGNNKKQYNSFNMKTRWPQAIPLEHRCDVGINSVLHCKHRGFPQIFWGLCGEGTGSSGQESSPMEFTQITKQSTSFLGPGAWAPWQSIVFFWNFLHYYNFCIAHPCPWKQNVFYVGSSMEINACSSFLVLGGMWISFNYSSLKWKKIACIILSHPSIHPSKQVSQHRVTMGLQPLPVHPDEMIVHHRRAQSYHFNSNYCFMLFVGLSLTKSFIAGHLQCVS